MIGQNSGDAQAKGEQQPYQSGPGPAEQGTSPNMVRMAMQYGAANQGGMMYPSPQMQFQQQQAQFAQQQQQEQQFAQQQAFQASRGFLPPTAPVSAVPSYNPYVTNTQYPMALPQGQYPFVPPNAGTIVHVRNCNTCMVY